MNRTARLAAYAVVLGFMFGGGVTLGAAIGPEPAPNDRTMTGDHATDALEPESDH